MAQDEMQKRFFDTLKDTFEHVRQIHFALILVCVTLIYVARASSTESTGIIEETNSLYALVTKLEHPTFSDLVRFDQQEKWRASYLGSFTASINEAYGHIDIGYASSWVVVEKPKTPFNVRVVRSSLNDIKKEIDAFTVDAHVPVKFRRLMLDPNPEHPIDTPSTLPATIHPFPHKDFVVKTIDPERNMAEIDYVVEEAVFCMTAMCPPPTRDKLATGKLEYDDVVEQLKLIPTFSERFPILTSSLPKLGSKKLKEIEKSAGDIESAARKGIKTKLFDIEIDGENIALVGSVAVNVILAYLLAYLGELNRYILSFESEVGSLYPPWPMVLWVGGQRGLFARGILILSVAAAPYAVYAIAERLQLTTNWEFLILLLAAIVFAVCAFRRAYRVQKHLKGLEGRLVKGSLTATSESQVP